MRTVLVSILAFMLSGAPAFAQSMQSALAAPAKPLRESARVEAAKFAALEAMQDDEYLPGGMKPGYFWSSIGLAAAGVGWLAVGALVATECSTVYEADCGGLGTGAVVLGGGLIGAGVLVFLLGKSKGSGNPELLWTPRGVGVRSRISF